MLSENRVLLADESCPVTDETLGKIYRASPHGLSQIIATVSPTARALLAVYCFRRAHLVSIGLAIAATCEKEELTSLGGNTGAALFERSREASQSWAAAPGATGRRKITLANLNTRSEVVGPGCAHDSDET